ncbi:MAG: hypothetical protein Ct9H90mP3_5690 [Flammeovirgaceae bacterium]|nr:MAG: hypothetical protein Ct9H90mP3_5690 [Flammeovirgaceae bacterium]
MVSEDITVIKTKKGIESNSFNMFLPYCQWSLL